MLRTTALLFLLALTLCAPAADSPERLIAHPEIKIETTEGDIRVSLDARRAPLTVRHFLDLVRADFYTGTIFHRVIADFMAQGGGYTIKYELKEDDTEIPNESGNGLSNERGTIAMARTNEPHSANSQFFVNLVDNTRLDPHPDHWGYTVFGEVIEGMDIVDTIASLPTGPGGPFRTDVPSVPILIEKIEIVAE